MADKEEIEGKDYKIWEKNGHKRIKRDYTSHPLKPGMSLQGMPDGIFTQEDFPELRRRARTVVINISNITSNDAESGIFEDLQRPIAGRAGIFVAAIDRFLEGKEQVTYKELAKAYVDAVHEMSEPISDGSVTVGGKTVSRKACYDDLMLGMGGTRFFRYGWYL